MKLLTKSVFFGALIASNLLSLSLISGIPEEYEEQLRIAGIKQQKEIENLPHEQQAKIKKFLARPDIQSLRTKMDTIGRRIALGAHFPVLERLKNSLSEEVELLKKKQAQTFPEHDWDFTTELNRLRSLEHANSRVEFDIMIFETMGELSQVHLQIAEKQNQQLEHDIAELLRLKLEYEQKLQEADAQDSE